MLPRSVVRRIQNVKRSLEDRRNARLTPSEVFSRIYRVNQWGGKDGLFHSGNGSTTDHIVTPYVRKIGDFLRNLPTSPTIVDLGCGDFQVGNHFVNSCSQYIAVDIVSDLIELHRSGGYPEHVTFLCLDIIEDPLPAGDVCLIRQVLQHLSNSQIVRILRKLHSFPIVFITEHYPSSTNVVPNLDKVHGSTIRLFFNSGVYLEHPPFNVFPHNLELFLETPGHKLGEQEDKGIIRTFKLQL